MNSTWKTGWTTWLLAGALMASVAWNFRERVPGISSRGAEERGGGAFPGSNGASHSAANCPDAPDLAALELGPEQRAAVEAWCSGACAASCGSEKEALGALERLHVALRDPDASPESLRALSAEVNRARERSLEHCVGAILEVRAVLTPAQLQSLMECCPESETSKP